LAADRRARLARLCLPGHRGEEPVLSPVGNPFTAVDDVVAAGRGCA
jgi:hypothetical protein